MSKVDLIALNLIWKKNSNIHCQYFPMKLPNCLIICFFLHISFLWSYAFILHHLCYGFFLFINGISLFCHWNSLKIADHSLFSKSRQMNLWLTFIIVDLRSKWGHLFLDFLFLFFYFFHFKFSLFLFKP
jgi:hypothetical protein